MKNKYFLTQLSLGCNGRLGNQMFQYAALKSLSLQTCIPFIISSDRHALNCFNIQCHQIPFDLLNSHSIDINLYNEKYFHYDEDFFQIQPYTNIHGYFQSEKYFSDISYIIKDEFKLSDKIKEKFCQSYIQKLKLHYNKEVVSIHVRRKDYLTLNEYHPAVSLEYLNTAQNMFKNCLFLIFSDDILWCKNNFIGEQYYFSDMSDDVSDLYLMSKCDHNIIANSSFSWWAAWLNLNSNKKVICPKTNWFGKELNHNNTKDLIPDSWISL